MGSLNSPTHTAAGRLAVPFGLIVSLLTFVFVGHKMPLGVVSIFLHLVLMLVSGGGLYVWMAKRHQKKEAKKAEEIRREQEMETQAKIRDMR